MNDPKLFKCLIFLEQSSLIGSTEDLYELISRAFACNSVLIATGGNGESFSFVCGILFFDSSGKSTTLKRKITDLFGTTCAVKFFKGWSPICIFFSSRDFKAFGCYSNDQIIKIALNAKFHKKLIQESHIYKHRDLYFRGFKKKSPKAFG